MVEWKLKEILQFFWIIIANFCEKIRYPAGWALDCPNRDGTVAHEAGGTTPLRPGWCHCGADAHCEQFYKEIDFMQLQWPDVRASGLFPELHQYTHVRIWSNCERYEQAINEPGVVGPFKPSAWTVCQMRPSLTADLSERMHNRGVRLHQSCPFLWAPMETVQSS